MLQNLNVQSYRNVLKDIVKISAQSPHVLIDYEIQKSKVSLINYISAFQQTLQISNQTLITGIALLKRIEKKGIRITQKLLYKLMVACLLLVQKLYNDNEYSVEDFSLASGIKIKELIKMENQIICILDYNLIISEREYYDVQLFSSIVN